jgi:hypothetical protein
MDLGEKLKLIERLGRLHSEGALTDEEFAAQKAELLGTAEGATVAHAGGGAAQQPALAAEPAPAWADDAVDPHSDSMRLLKWGAGAAAILAVVGGSIWLGQSRAEPPPDALIDGASGAAASSSSAKAVRAEQLVGTWTPDSSCISDSGFDLYADGSVGYEDGSGRWSVENGKLVTVDESGRDASTIQSLNGDSLALLHADGSVTRFRRCSPAQVAAAKRAAEADAALTTAGEAVDKASAAVDGASDELFTADERRAIDAYERLNSACRGGSGDDPSTMAACDKRDVAGLALEARGICYGKKDQAGYEMRHHHCGPDSLRSEG